MRKNENCHHRIQRDKYFQNRLVLLKYLIFNKYTFVTQGNLYPVRHLFSEHKFFVGVGECMASLSTRKYVYIGD